MGTTFESRASMPTAVYRCYAEDGTLLYVGASIYPDQRIEQHRTSKAQRSTWTADLARVEVEWFDSRYAAEAAEERAIRDESPVANRRPGGATGVIYGHSF